MFIFFVSVSWFLFLGDCLNFYLLNFLIGSLRNYLFNFHEQLLFSNSFFRLSYCLMDHFSLNISGYTCLRVWTSRLGALTMNETYQQVGTALARTGSWPYITWILYMGTERSLSWDSNDHALAIVSFLRLFSFCWSGCDVAGGEDESHFQIILLFSTQVLNSCSLSYLVFQVLRLSGDSE